MNGGNEDSCAAQIAINPRVDRIRCLNDQLRRDALRLGRVVVTSGIDALGAAAIVAIVTAISVFDDFSPDNDPYSEHDMGSLKWATQTIFWKVDYYDRDLRFGSPDPADPAVTERVLTIMLAEEY